MKPMKTWTNAWAGLLLAVLVFGCGNDDVRYSKDSTTSQDRSASAGKGDDPRDASDAPSLDSFDRDVCIDLAFWCALEDLKKHEGTVGPAQAEASFNGCLEKKTTLSDRPCTTACDGDPIAGSLCGHMQEQLEFFSGQPEACAERFADCAFACSEAAFGPGQGFDVSISNMCYRDGFNGNCVDYARNTSECGGSLSDEDAVCHAQCEAVSGTWNEELGDICIDECGPCELVCAVQRELYTLPNDGLVGTVQDGFQGELDPLVIGDVCITYVEVREEWPADLSPGLYGLVEDLGGACAAVRTESHQGQAVHVPLTALAEVTDPDRLEVLETGRPATYFDLLDSESLRLLRSQE